MKENPSLPSLKNARLTVGA